MLLNIRLLLVLLFCFVKLSSASNTDTTKYDDGSLKIRKGNWNYYFDSKKRLKSVKRHETFFWKGYVKYYDTSGTLASEGKLKINNKHGKWRLIESGQVKIVKYKYGLEKSKTWNQEGRKMYLILTHGKGARNKTIEKQRIIYKPVAGCIVTRKILFVSSLHNLPIRFRNMVLFGLNWDEIE